MIPYEIPLTPEPQTFSIQLAGVDYFLRLAWNVASDCWVLDLADVDRRPLVNGIPLVTGLDLLEPYRYLGIGGYLIVQSDFNADAVPTFTSLGVTGRLYFVVEG